MRQLHRENGVNTIFPVSCVLRGAGRQYIAEVVNYHFKGACLRVEQIRSEDRPLIEAGEFKLDFYLGQNCLQSDIAYRMSWRDEREGFVFGVEFKTKITNHMERNERFLINPKVPVQISAVDPMDPLRQIFFQAIDVSETGMLLKTSLTNKHLLPGMKIRQVKLMIPTQETIDTELRVENTRPGSDEGSFLLGITVRDRKKEYTAAIRNYLPIAMPQIQDIDTYMQKIRGTAFQSKALKSVVNYKIVQTEDVYEKILKLRFSGYGKHDKVKKGTTWREQGEGLKNEGMIIGGFIGSELVCSMELRFGDGPLPLRTLKMSGLSSLPGVDVKRVVEMNKVVVHPKIQGSDLVLGLLQRAHTIVVNKGQLDVLGVATDKLVSLYEKMGAIRVGARFPHPHLENEYLNLIMVKREVYHDGYRFNPHAWSVVYKSIHEHYVELGLARERKFSTKDRILAAATRLTLMRKNKDVKPKNQAVGALRTGSTSEDLSARYAGFIDPKWTRQEFTTSVMLSYIKEAELMAGEQVVRKILDEIGVPEKYLRKQSNWLSVAFHDAFLDAFSSHGDIRELSKRAGMRSMKKDMLGMNYYVLKHFLTPDMVYNSFDKILPKFNRTRTYEVREYKSGRAKVSLGFVSRSQIPKHRESCENWTSSFEHYVNLMTGKPGKVKKVACCYDGANACTYEVEWDINYLKITPHLPVVAACGLPTIAYIALQPSLGAVHAAIRALAMFAGIIFLFLGRRYRKLAKDFDNTHHEFVTFQQEAAERYEELQQSKMKTDEMYREARIIEQTMRDIQQKENLGELLQTALDAVCTNFQFDRGFAMIVDKQKKILRTAAVAGVQESADSVWKFSVDISQKKDNPALLSSVFHSGNSVVIDDVESHLFQLNEASRAIINQFGSKGFVMVAIPAKTGNWGVIIADKKTKEKRLSERDLVVVERLSQQIGIALDKNADLERERHLRSQFQRYAPSALLLSSEQSEAQLALGAQLKQIGILFIDIRGFTSMSETLPPTKMLEVVNGLYTLLDPVVRKYGGIVDKYLGDGALVTWGTLGARSPNADEMVSCSLEFLQALAAHNKSIRLQGLAPLKVGIGMHMGEAVVGNVGSKERQEYTAIGRSVNLAARLEQLSKVYNAEIVASEEIIDQLSDKELWKPVQDVKIRGLESSQTVWTYSSRTDSIMPQERGEEAA